MKPKESVDLLKKMSEKGCFCCGEPVSFTATQIRMVTRSESGEILFSFDNDEESISMMLPLCDYHMVLASEGWLLYDDTIKMVVQSKLVTVVESKSDKDLRLESARLRRMPKNDMNGMMKEIISSVLSARKFRDGMKEKKELGKD
jgi:hypothetical protein